MAFLARGATREVDRFADRSILMMMMMMPWGTVVDGAGLAFAALRPSAALARLRLRTGSSALRAERWFTKALQMPVGAGLPAGGSGGGRA